MTFWLVIAAMTALGVALVALPAARTRAAADDVAREDHVRRLRELEADVVSGEVEPEVAGEVRAELERSVLAAPASEAPAALGRIAALGTAAVLVPLIALAVYFETGAPEVGTFAARHPDLPVATPRASVELLLEQVRRRTEDVPDDAQAWTVLARTQLELGRYDAAVEAAEALYRLEPGDASALLLLIDTLGMQNGGRIAGRAAELVDTLLEAHPGHPTGLVLKGIAAQEAGDPAAAAAWWRRALDGLAPDSPVRAELAALLGEAPAQAPGPAGDARVDVVVDLDEALAGETRPDDTVWVIARAVEGPPAPLAVSRHTAAELPLNVTLDASMAMVPGVSLADFSRVRLVARVSRSGEVRAASGDLEGSSGEVRPGAGATATVTIDRVVP